MGIKSTIAKMLPNSLLTAISAHRKSSRSTNNLLHRYGQIDSMRKGRCIDAEGNPLPWYTYPAIEYLDSLDFTSCSVLEYGSGASSQWWLKRAKAVLSVEHNPEWFSKSIQPATGNVEFLFADTEESYLSAGAGQRFGVVVIDGIYRHKCALRLEKRMSENAIVILDNSDWHPTTAKTIRDQFDLIQVDFHGFGPINEYSWTTSIFFSRDFTPNPRGSRLPIPSVAAAIVELDANGFPLNEWD